LTELDLANNKLVGTIPANLGNMVKMQGLFLSNNKLHGPIPVQLLHSDMAQLTQIFVHGNLLSGTVPVGLADLPKLKNLFIDDNKFTGTVPPELCARNFNELFFQSDSVPVRGGDKDYDDFDLWDDDRFDNDLFDDFFDDDDDWLYDDDIDEGQDDYVENNPDLYIDDLYQSEVYKQIDELEQKKHEEETAIMNEMKKVEQYEVDEESALVKQIQALQKQQEADGISKEEYDNLKAQIKELEEDLVEVGDVRGKEEAELEADYEEVENTRNQQLEQLKGELGNRGLEGFITHHKNRATTDIEITERNGCNSIACPAGYRSTKDGKDGVFPCVKCDHDLVNPYLGSTRCFEVNQRLILSHFYYATHGKEWVGDYKSWDKVDIPVCEWEGVRCNAHNDIISIVLTKSNLKGTISEDFGFLRHLAVLDLSNNNLIGNLPSELHYAPLERLDISGNMLSGFVAPSLCGKGGVNGNGENGKFSCSYVACPVGTHSSTGHASSVEDCVPCRSNEYSYLGGNSCIAYENLETTENSSSNAGAVSGIVISLFCGVTLLISAVLWGKRRRREQYSFGDRNTNFGGYGFGMNSLNSSYQTTNLAPAANNIDADPFRSGTFAMSTSEVKAQDDLDTGKKSGPNADVWLDIPRIA